MDKKILLVEDDPFLADIYTTKLKEEGFSVDTAQDGEECLKKIQTKTPDLLVLDVVLPQMDGWEVLSAVRRQEKFKDLKVVILSNLGQKEEVKKGLELGATKYFIKAHYTPAEVVKEIKEILK
ncbi:MAG: response regulator [Nanoarchaeota archaeon]